MLIETATPQRASDVATSRLAGMALRTEKVLWSFALLCAISLLSAPLVGGRTVWAGRGGQFTEAAGWDWLVPALGAVAIAGLVAGLFLRPQKALAAIGAAVATMAFGAAAYAAGTAWIALLQGSTLLEGSAPGNGVLYELRYPSRPQPFAIIATIATGFALVLTVSWLEPAEDEW